MKSKNALASQVDRVEAGYNGIQQEGKWYTNVRLVIICLLAIVMFMCIVANWIEQNDDALREMRHPQGTTFLFDTSSIPDDAVITDATLVIPLNAKEIEAINKTGITEFDLRYVDK